MALTICWRVVRVVTSREAVVNRALLRRGLETYLPMEVRSYRPSRHTKRRVCVEVPLIPGRLFAALTAEVENSILRQFPEADCDIAPGGKWKIGDVVKLSASPPAPKFRYVTGLQRDVFGELVLIPAVQMARFIECHQAWIQEALRKAASGKPGAGGGRKKRKWTPLDSPGALQTIMKELFGVEDTAMDSMEAA